MIHRAIVRCVGYLVLSGSVFLLVQLFVKQRPLHSEGDWLMLIGAVAGACIGVGVILFKRWARNLCIVVLIGVMCLVGSDKALWRTVSRFNWYVLPLAGYCLFCLYAIPVLAFVKLEDKDLEGTKQQKKKKPRGKRQKR